MSSDQTGRPGLTTAHPDEIFAEGLSRRQGWIGGIWALIVFGVFLYFGSSFGQARAALVSAVAIISATMICWPARRRTWFRITMGVVAAVHLAAVFLVTWSNEQIAGVMFVPIMLADTAAIVSLIWLVNEVMKPSIR